MNDVKKITREHFVRILVATYLFVNGQGLKIEQYANALFDDLEPEEEKDDV
jgi:hypothetical protein